MFYWTHVLLNPCFAELEANGKAARNSVFIKLWQEVGAFNYKSLFCFCGQLNLTFFNCHNFINTLTLYSIAQHTQAIDLYSAAFLSFSTWRTGHFSSWIAISFSSESFVEWRLYCFDKSFSAAGADGMLWGRSFNFRLPCFCQHLSFFHRFDESVE